MTAAASRDTSQGSSGRPAPWVSLASLACHHPLQQLQGSQGHGLSDSHTGSAGGRCRKQRSKTLVPEGLRPGSHQKELRSPGALHTPTQGLCSSLRPERSSPRSARLTPSPPLSLHSKVIFSEVVPNFSTQTVIKPSKLPVPFPA